MKVSLGTLLIAALAAGCTSETTNPNLLAPKVVVHPWADGNVTVYVHSAFGEHDYDWLTLAVDNVTVADVTGGYSLEERIQASGFFLTVRAGASGEVFESRVRVDVEPGRARARIAILDSGGDWADARNVNLPFERILDRIRAEESP